MSQPDLFDSPTESPEDMHARLKRAWLEAEEVLDKRFKADTLTYSDSQSYSDEQLAVVEARDAYIEIELELGIDHAEFIRRMIDGRKGTEPDPPAVHPTKRQLYGASPWRMNRRSF